MQMVIFIPAKLAQKRSKLSLVCSGLFYNFLCFVNGWNHCLWILVKGMEWTLITVFWMSLVCTFKAEVWTLSFLDSARRWSWNIKINRVWINTCPVKQQSLWNTTKRYPLPQNIIKCSGKWKVSCKRKAFSNSVFLLCASGVVLNAQPIYSISGWTNQRAEQWQTHWTAKAESCFKLPPRQEVDIYSGQG